MTLKVQKSVDRQSVVFELAGRIQAEQISELENLVNSEASVGRVVLDLTYVKLVDRDAVQFLASQEAGGTELRNCSKYIRQWIAQENKRNGSKV